MHRDRLTRMMFSFILAMVVLVAGIAALKAETVVLPGQSIVLNDLLN